jgi:hypothetical protein
MTGPTSDPEWEQIVRYWGDSYALSRDPDDRPADPYAARRMDGTGATIRAATPALLLDAVKDDAASRHTLTAGETP